jgi:hypothetical protein
VHPLVPILQLLNLLKRVDGRKKLQKIVHILQELGAPFRERFEYSFYGMYSKQLRSELDSLAADKLLLESETSNDFGAPSYVFECGPAVAPLLREVGADSVPAWEDSATKLNTLSPKLLEGISTILFLRKQGMDGEALKRHLLELKPHLADCYDECRLETESLIGTKNETVLR